MTCSINVNRKKGLHEVKYVPVDDPIFLDEEEELDYKFLFEDLYEKVGELKRRVEKLEGR